MAAPRGRKMITSRMGKLMVNHDPEAQVAEDDDDTDPETKQVATQVAVLQLSQRPAADPEAGRAGVYEAVDHLTVQDDGEHCRHSH